MKPCNILLDRHLNPKLCDFGLAKFFQGKGRGRHTFVGTPSFIAPEIIVSTEGAVDAFTVKADVYSFSVVLWQLLTLKEPYEGLHYTKVLYRPSRLLSFYYCSCV